MHALYLVDSDLSLGDPFGALPYAAGSYLLQVGRLSSHFSTKFVGSVICPASAIRTPGRLRVNRRACHFGRYENPRRPRPSPRAGRVSRYLG